jgi:uncharacterized protein (TIGR02453 family)
MNGRFRLAAMTLQGKALEGSRIRAETAPVEGGVRLCYVSVPQNEIMASLRGGSPAQESLRVDSWSLSTVLQRLRSTPVPFSGVEQPMTVAKGDGSTMTAKAAFRGFSRDCVQFYQVLARNNDKGWFTANKQVFENAVMNPARDFVYEMGNLLKEISPKVVADPRQDRSIFRHYRDTRFSHDKSPYKTHLVIFWWEGSRTKMECPGYYFHLEPPNLLLGVGIHCFSKPLLEQYRDSVVDSKQGEALAKAVASVQAKGYAIGIRYYKKTPRGYDPGHKNAELLLHNGLTAAFTVPIPEELYSEDILEYCFNRFRDMSPVHGWLLEMIKKVD